MRLTEIVIPASEAEADNCWQAGAWASQVIQMAIDEAGYELDELPEDAVRFDDLWDYLARWANSGHALVSENTDENSGSWHRAAQLFDRLEFAGHGALLRDFAAFAVANRDRVNDLYADGEEATARELFEPFDDRLSAQSPSFDDLRFMLRDWLLRQPWVRVDDGDEPASAARMQRSIPRHPLAEQRLAARKRQRLAEHHGEAAVLKRRLLALLDRKSPR
ncbi:hypothetical protein [Glacieibacterium frigidum]|uniref:DUF4375 domain-containing protein n=1 Tax=Glacieibacterium frigidum TaxID=2593303 RepID=A0A552UIS8_9SPHN|nr:hypothetical protein [Glacieibacterium frigidum]TRW18123.1 hypothetical protein FMM06_08455 [Glacieibacterium frigidum]